MTTQRPHSITPYAREICNLATTNPGRVGEQISKYPPIVHQHLAALFRVGTGQIGTAEECRAKLNITAQRIPSGEAVTEITEAGAEKLAKGLTEGLRRIAG